MGYKDRHQQGRTELASLIGHLQDRGGISNSQLAAIADWAMGEPSPIHKSTVSHLRNRNYARGASLAMLEALVAVNRAIWLWVTSGSEAAIAEHGPHQRWGVDAETLNGAIWLPAKGTHTQPLTLCDLVELTVGRWKPPWLDVTLAFNEGALLSRELADLLWSLVADAGPRDALGRILAAVPDAPETREAVTALLSGSNWSTDDVQARLAEMAATVCELRGQPPGSVTPSALLAQLSAGRRRT